MHPAVVVLFHFPQFSETLNRLAVTACRRNVGETKGNLVLRTYPDVNDNWQYRVPMAYLWCVWKRRPLPIPMDRTVG